MRLKAVSRKTHVHTNTHTFSDTDLRFLLDVDILYFQNVTLNKKFHLHHSDVFLSAESDPESVYYKDVIMIMLMSTGWSSNTEWTA